MTLMLARGWWFDECCIGIVKEKLDVSRKKEREAVVSVGGGCRMKRL